MRLFNTFELDYERHIQIKFFDNLFQKKKP